MKMALFYSLVFMMCALTSSAFARTTQTTRKSKIPTQYKNHNVVRENGHNVLYKKRNVVEFDDSLIQGEVKNPSEFYFVHRPAEKFGGLLDRRKNFHKEMLRDTVMIR